MALTRRAALRSGSLLLAGSVAGCLGGGSGGETVQEMPSPTIGPDDASVTVQAFEDYACPHCRTFAVQVLPRIESEYVSGGDVKYEHHDFPFVHPDWSWKTASAARAVQDEQGDEAFFEFSHKLYQNMNNYSIDLISTLADAVGADPEPIADAARNLTYKPVLEADKELGKQKGVQGTPTVFVDDQKAQDFSFETVSQLIESRL